MGIPADGLDRNNGDVYPGNNMQFDLHNWMNLLPQLVADHEISYYATNAGGSGVYNSRIFPFPGNGIGKIWTCPSAAMPMVDLQQLSGGGVGGFFSYVMNIDLKRVASATAPGSYLPFPREPRLASLSKPSATVFMEDAVFNYAEGQAVGYTSGNYTYSVDPALRWRSFPSRHGKAGGILNFVDGHSSFYKSAYINRQQPNAWEWLNPDVIWNPPLPAGQSVILNYKFKPKQKNENKLQKTTEVIFNRCRHDVSRLVDNKPGLGLHGARRLGYERTDRRRLHYFGPSDIRFRRDR